MKEIGVLKVTVNRSSDVVRHIFVKSFGADKEKKSVIMANLPSFCDASSFTKIIKENFGNFETISFHSSVEKLGINERTFDGLSPFPINGFRALLIRFKKRESYLSVFKFISKGQNLSLFGDGKPVTGLAKWKGDYNDSIMDLAFTKDQIAKYIIEYDKRVELEREQAKEQEGIPDEEGWIKVTRHGKKQFLPNSEALEKKIMEKVKAKKAKTGDFPYKEKVQSESF